MMIDAPAEPESAGAMRATNSQRPAETDDSGEDAISPSSPPSPTGEALARGNPMTDGVVFTGYFHGGTLTDSSRLYSAALERFNVLRTEDDMLPSFSNCSAQ